MVFNSGSPTDLFSMLGFLLPATTVLGDQLEEMSLQKTGSLSGANDLWLAVGTVMVLLA